MADNNSSNPKPLLGQQEKHFVSFCLPYAVQLFCATKAVLEAWEQG